MYEPKRPPYITIIIVSIIILVGFGIYTLATQFLAREAPFEPEASAVITQVIPTATPRLIATPHPTNTPTTVPTATPAPTSLRFGVLDRDDGCDGFNQVVMMAVAQMNMRMVPVTFDNAESLYEALATQAIDLTLCFQDPTDRPFLTEHVGFLKTIDAPYFDDGEIRLQVMVNAANVVPLREEQPCLLHFLQAMTFNTKVDQPETWLTENQTEILEWRNCS